MSKHVATLACLLCLVGCKTAHEHAEVDALLSAVTYDTSAPTATPSVSATAKPDFAVASSRTRLGEKAGSFGQAVVDGLKTTAGVLLYGVFKLFESALGFDDDDDHDYTPKGRADRDFKQWLDDRDRWRREE